MAERIESFNMKNQTPGYEPDIKKTMQNLKANNMEPLYFENAEGALEWVKNRLSPGSKVAIGGSNTLRDIGVTGYIEDGDFQYTSRYVRGQTFKLDTSIPPEVVRRSYLEAFTADYFLMSTNAVTENGELVNVDGMGNRVAALAFGPKEVIIIVGRNKIVRDLPAAFDRLGKIISVGGMGEQRNIDTPCRKTGYCISCKSEKRPCCIYTIMSHQQIPPQTKVLRIKVLIVNEELGF
jgi:hypothetical protein